ncbi:MAG: 3-deoxy-D-manno-octulosonic acid transferase [Nitrospirae bacterium]|nr:3-deoxy-D-manno-octulosonic acid transferase [Nitrospirota bacterium]
MFNGLYSALYTAALAFLLPFEYLKRPVELRKRWLVERFGIYEAARFCCAPVWIHAVSVGEVIASVPLLKKIKERHPSLDVIISTVTDTGQKVARERAGAYAEIIYVPFDFPFAVRNALCKVRPAVFIIMETELWPNIIRILKENNVPVVLMNGRLSERSHKGYKKMVFFIKHVLRNFTFLCVQDDIYAERFRSLGAEPERIKVLGSFKFDTRPSSSVPAWTETLSGPIIIAGSTHETEEDLILDAYMRLKSDFPGLNLIIAPRHPERFRTVEELLKKSGLKYIKRSDIPFRNGDTEKTASGLVVLLDVIGELSAVYGAADIAVMGGSFIEHGGQNPLEPAFWRKAVVCGPHMENFPFMEEFYSSKGAVMAEARLLYGVLKGLLDSPEEMHRMGGIAKDLYEKNSGATDRAMEIIEKILTTR